MCKILDPHNMPKGWPSTLDERQKDYPGTWKGLLCHCTRDESIRPFPWFTWVNGIATTCNTCGKTEQWRLQQCSTCDDYFIMDFSHPAYCIYDPECWVCLESNKPDVVDVHSRSRKKIPPALGKLYKYVLNPVDPLEVFGF